MNTPNVNLFQGYLKLPLLLSLILILCGEFTGALLGGYKHGITAYFERQIMNYPEIHGLENASEFVRKGRISKVIMGEITPKIHLFHVHCNGVGLVIFLMTFTLSLIGASLKWETLASVLLAAGFFYPFGWLSIALLVPSQGIERAFQLTETFLIYPFASLFLFGLIVVVILLILKVCFHKGNQHE